MPVDIMGNYSLAYVILVLVINSVICSEIELTTSSSSLQPPLTANLTLRCSLHDTPNPVSGGIVGRRRRDAATTSHNISDLDLTSSTLDHKNLTAYQKKSLRHQTRQAVASTSENVDFVTSIIISRDGVDIASVSGYVAAKAVVNSPNLQVTGAISQQTGEKGFLQLTWTLPTRQETGNYQCDIDTLNKVGHSFDFRKTLVVSEDEVSLSDLVNHVQKLEQQKINDLKKVEQQQNTTINAMKAEIAALQISELQQNATINSMKTEIATLKAAEQQQKTEIATLKQDCNNLETRFNKSNTKVFFSAGSTQYNGHHYTSGDVIIYDKVFTNVGGAYDVGSGVFHCDVAGFYSFTISAMQYNTNVVYVKLQHNNDEVIQLLINSYSNDYFKSTSNSVTINLSRGDSVKVVAESDTCFRSDSDSVTTTFNGELIAVA